MTAQPARILVVDDDPCALEVVSNDLAGRGYDVLTATTGEEALRGLDSALDVVLLDRSLPDVDGLELLDRTMRLRPAPTVVMLTGYADVNSVVEAMRAGAWDYVAKPFRIDALVRVVERALAHRRASATECADEPALDAIVGCAPALQRAKTLLRRIATSPASTVLITGESGTGKDLAAKAIHACSHRASGPFVNVTCSALPGSLLESELFGHERGAFTDAKTRKSGLVERANGGTLFLDEMGEMDPGLQAKLLRFLEEKAFRRVGGTVDLRADVRVVAATNVELPSAVAAKRFREDLYYRLAVLTVELPPLRERPGDVPLLAHYFLARFAEAFEKPLRGITPRAMELLEAHSWPGNIRELKNTIERAALLAHDEVLDRADFELTPVARSSAARQEVQLPPSGVDLRELERTLVRQALCRCKGNVTRAARLLGLNRDQVRYRVTKFGLQDELAVQRTE